ncbi:MAG: hypothetical protein IT234_01105 [Bacteroidia bacterium]|nr:hypothetical protein [Bacteroidia bacterium]
MFTLLLSVTVLFNQCKKERLEGTLLGEIKFSADELSYFPYAVNDSLIFKDSLGNSHTFWVISFSRGFYPVYEKHGDPQSNYYHMENIQIKFTDQYGTLQNINMIKQREVQSTYVNTRFSPPNLTTNDSAYTEFSSYMDSNKFSTSTDVYYSSLTLVNRTFYEVSELINYFSPYATVDNLASIYYAKNIGIVGFRTRDGTKWYLDN